MYSPPDSSPAIKNPISSPLPHPDRAIPKDVSHADRAAPALPECRFDPPAARLPAGFAPDQFVNQSVPAADFSIYPHTHATLPGDASRRLLAPAELASCAAAIRAPCRVLLPRASD